MKKMMVYLLSKDEKKVVHAEPDIVIICAIIFWGPISR